MSNTNTNLTTFLDSIGRTVIGKVVAETDTTMTVQNPALVAVQPNPQSNQLQLQILPLFFKEFLANQTNLTNWIYKKASVTMSQDIEFNAQFSNQYEQLFGAPAPAKSGEVVKLFDEE